MSHSGTPAHARAAIRAGHPVTGAPNWRSLSAVVAAHAVGIVMSILSPFIIGALVRGVGDGGFGIGESTSGIIITVELLSIAAGTYAVAPVLQRLSLRMLAVRGLAVCLIANLASAFVAPAEVWWLMLSRALAGFGAGVVYAVGSAAAARWANPDRTFAVMVVLGTLISAAGLLLIPLATNHFGYRGGFAFVLANVLVLAPLLAYLPSGRQSPEASPATAAGPGLKPGARPDSTLVIMLLAAMLLLNLGDGAIFYFSEGLGARVGADTQEVGFVLTLATFAGLLGASTAAALDTRFGRSLPLAAALLTKAAASIAIVLLASKAAYVVLQQIHAFTVYFTIPYILGLSALADRQGRVAAMVGGTILIGSGVSASMGGYVVEHLGYAYLGFGTALVVAVNLLLVFPVAARFDRLTNTEPVASEA